MMPTEVLPLEDILEAEVNLLNKRQRTVLTLAQLGGRASAPTVAANYVHPEGTTTQAVVQLLRSRPDVRYDDEHRDWVLVAEDLECEMCKMTYDGEYHRGLCSSCRPGGE